MKPSPCRVPMLLVLVVTAVSSAQAQVFKQGADLHEALQQDVQSSNALNYIVGVVDALNGARSKDGSCFDLRGEPVAGARLSDTVRAYLLKNPQLKQQAGSSVVSAALAEVWPCR